MLSYLIVRHPVLVIALAIWCFSTVGVAVLVGMEWLAEKRRGKNPPPPSRPATATEEAFAARQTELQF